MNLIYFCSLTFHTDCKIIYNLKQVGNWGQNHPKQSLEYFGVHWLLRVHWIIYSTYYHNAIIIELFQDNNTPLLNTDSTSKKIKMECYKQIKMQCYKLIATHSKLPSVHTHHKEAMHIPKQFWGRFNLILKQSRILYLSITQAIGTKSRAYYPLHIARAISTQAIFG